MSNSCARGSNAIGYENANSGVIRPKADASLYVVDSRASYAKAPKPDP